MIRWEQGDGIPSESVRSLLAKVLGGTRDDYGPRAVDWRATGDTVYPVRDPELDALRHCQEPLPGLEKRAAYDAGDPEVLLVNRLLDRKEIRRQLDRIRRLEERVQELETTIAALYNEVEALRLAISRRTT